VCSMGKGKRNKRTCHIPESGSHLLLLICMIFGRITVAHCGLQANPTCHLLLFCFFAALGLNSRPCACQAGAVLLEPFLL
jgi:hypothetical protein